MDLVLWRHAEAHELSDDGDDMSRRLTVKGEKQAARMALWLDKHLPPDARVFSSPAVRAEQTARALSRKIRINPQLSPFCLPEDMLEVVNWPQANDCALVVGHQPILGQTIAQLLGMPSGECAVRKGAVWWLRLRQRNGMVEPVVLTVQNPEML